jgi:hypothetical protein
MRRAISPTSIASIVLVVILGGAAVYVAAVSLGGSSSTVSFSQSMTSPVTTTSENHTSVSTIVNSTTTTPISTTEITTIVNETTSTSSSITTQFLSPGATDVVQSCASRGNPDQNVSCSLPTPVTQGHLLLVEIAEVPGYQIVTSPGLNTNETETSMNTPEIETSTVSVPSVSLYDSLGDNFTMIGNATQSASTYLLYIYVANITSSAADRVTLSGIGSYPFLLVHELQNVTRVVASSTGSGNSTSPSVSSYSAPSGSFIFSGIFVLNNLGTPLANASAGAGSTLLDTTYGLADEYSVGGGPITSPFVMSAVIPWGEVSVAFE